jgi:glycosyltransferase involved in cell wall biosynthesis
MKIAVHNMGTYAHARQLAGSLARRGHDVAYLYCPSVGTPARSSVSFAPSDRVWVVPVGLGAEFSKRNLARRLLQERAYGAQAGSLLAGMHPDLVISGDTPIEVQAAILSACRRASLPFVLWLTDIYSIGIKSVLSRLPIVGSVAALRYAHLERWVVRASDAIVAIADDFREVLVGWGVDGERMTVIPNWGVLPKTAPPSKNNDWAARHGLCGKRVLVYAGTLAFKHDPERLLELAAEFRDEPDIRIVVVSEGHGAQWLARRQAQFSGLLVLPFQPEADYRNALAAADILLAILEPAAAEFSVPSKVLTYMTAGRAILAAIAPSNLAARTIRAAGAGLVADPGDPAAFCHMARKLIDDDELRRRCGEAGLAYAHEHFEIDGITRRFEGVFQKLVGRTAVPAPLAMEGDRIAAGPR